MKTCVSCGNEIHQDCNYCPICATKQPKDTTLRWSSPKANLPPQGNQDAPNFGFALLGFLFPLVGLILFLVWKTEYPRRAGSAGKGALLAFALEMACVILYIALIALALALS